jgi:hypothetical protein
VAVLKFIAFEYDGFIKEEEETIRPFFATNTMINSNIGRISIKSYKIKGAKSDNNFSLSSGDISESTRFSLWCDKRNFS